MSKTILVVAAHADDEALGCGGTIARHVSEGDLVHVIFMADGVNSRMQNDTAELQRRNRARDAAMRILGVKSWHALDFPDNCIDSVPLLLVVQSLEPIFQKVQPNRVYTHHYGDLNIDHRLTHQAVMTVCRPTPRSSVSEILAFEVVSSTEWATPGVAPFSPNAFVDISDHLLTKIEALEAYDMEMRPPPHSRSIAHIKTLAQHRGYSVGVEAAEAFEVVRVVE